MHVPLAFSLAQSIVNETPTRSISPLQLMTPFSHLLQLVLSIFALASYLLPIVYTEIARCLLKLVNVPTPAWSLDPKNDSSRCRPITLNLDTYEISEQHFNFHFHFVFIVSISCFQICCYEIAHKALPHCNLQVLYFSDVTTACFFVYIHTNQEWEYAHAYVNEAKEALRSQLEPSSTAQIKSVQRTHHYYRSENVTQDGS